MTESKPDFGVETKEYQRDFLDAIDELGKDEAINLMLAAAGRSASSGVPQNSPAGRARNQRVMTDGGTEAASNDGSGDGMFPMAGNTDWSQLAGVPEGAGWRQIRSMMGNSGMQYGGARDLYQTFGYSRNVPISAMKQAYRRDDIAQRIVDIYPNTTWRERPEISDDEDDNDEQTEFESDVQALFDDHRLLQRLKDADRLEGLGYYSCLVYGLHDENDLIEPVEDGALEGTGEYSGTDGIAHLTPIGPDRIETVFVGDDPESDNYGEPIGYRIDFGPDDDDDANIVPISQVGSGSDNIETDDGEQDPNAGVSGMKYVNADRVLHLAEDTKSTPLKSDPRLLVVWNRLNDIWKVVGSAAELFYRGADYGLHLNADGPIDDEQNVVNEVMDYLHGLQPYIKTSNMEVERLGGEQVDPSGPFDVLMKLIAGVTAIPQRILTGSERGELASTQDRATFFGRVAERQRQYAGPEILRKFLKDMIRIGAVSKPLGTDSDGVGPFSIEWPNLFELNEVEKAELAAKLSKALKDSASAVMSSEIMNIPEIRELVFDIAPEVGSEASIKGDGDGTEDDADEEPGDRPGDSGDEGADGLPELDEDDPDVQAVFDQASNGGQQVAMTDGGRDRDEPMSLDEFNDEADSNSDSIGGFEFGE